MTEQADWRAPFVPGCCCKSCGRYLRERAREKRSWPEEKYQVPAEISRGAAVNCDREDPR